MVVYLLVEGRLDEAVGQRIIEAVGGNVGTTFGLKGVAYIERKVDGFNDLAKGVPILTLVDLADLNIDCPVEAVNQWLPNRSEQMLLRMVVQKIESWLLADRTGIAQFLGIRTSLVPHDPERLEDPKEALVELARRSSYASVKNDLVPADPTQNNQGPGFTYRMSRFARQRWDLNAAMKNAASLHRCVRRVRELIQSP